MPTIQRPRFEDPIDSAKQMIENNITVFFSPGSLYWIQFFGDSPIPEYQSLSMDLAMSSEEYWDVIELGVIRNGTHAMFHFKLTERLKSLGRWWKGNRVKGVYPYSGYLSDKKWHLNEASDIFSFIFC